jgi:hypothetical protein
MVDKNCAQVIDRNRGKLDMKNHAELSAKSWTQESMIEAELICKALLEHASDLAAEMSPQPAQGREEVQAWADTRRDFKDVDELKKALRDMGQQKAGRSLAVEHLLHLDEAMLATWLYP